MHNCLRFVIAFFVVVSTCDAQFAPCNASKPATVEPSDGVTQLEVKFLGPTGEHIAHVFVPDSDTAVAGIVFPTQQSTGVNTAWTCCDLLGALLSRVRLPLFSTERLNGRRQTTIPNSPIT
jgi:hypothetical protein